MLQPRTHLAGFLACCALALVLLSGCAVRYQQGLPPGMQGVFVPDTYQGRFIELETEGERNWVLNLDELALQALKNGDHDLAKRALDEAILLIEIIYGDSDQAQRARTLFFEEDSKIFKGDPYERSMTYFYRGVLYMNDADWDNARACFRSAILQDAFTEESQNAGDWAIFDYLIGVCEVRLGRPDYAQEAFARAQKTYAGFRDRYYDLSGDSMSRLQVGEFLPPFTPLDNLLVLVQTGTAPKKVAEGNYGEFLAFLPGRGTGGRPDISVDGRPAGAPVVADSLFYQAATRGGRELDAILGRQAQFKEGTEAVATTSAYAGAVVLNEGLRHRDDDTAVAGAILLAAGIIVQGLSDLMKPNADVRAWTTLPDAIGAWPAMLPAGEHKVSVGYGSGPASAIVDLSNPGTGLTVLLAFPAPNQTLVAPQKKQEWILAPERTEP
ncbi:hypothetical protein KQI84_11685 [bacterium]|nr:hypothetical protein [bacterium]